MAVYESHGVVVYGFTDFNIISISVPRTVSLSQADASGLWFTVLSNSTSCHLCRSDCVPWASRCIRALMVLCSVLSCHLVPKVTFYHHVMCVSRTVSLGQAGASEHCPIDPISLHMGVTCERFFDPTWLHMRVMVLWFTVL